MFIAGPNEKNHVITLEQDGEDVNIMVDGILVAWFEGEELVIEEYSLRDLGLVYELV